MVDTSFFLQSIPRASVVARNGYNYLGDEGGRAARKNVRLGVTHTSAEERFLALTARSQGRS
jgi:hypothetical protein